MLLRHSPAKLNVHLVGFAAHLLKFLPQSFKLCGNFFRLLDSEAILMFHSFKGRNQIFRRSFDVQRLSDINLRHKRIYAAAP